MSEITPSEVIGNHINEMLTQLYTSMPAKVVKVYKKESMTVVDVQPMLNMRFKDGSVIQEPPLGGVPIMWPSAGGCFITMPIEIGDEVMLHFSMRSSAEYKNGDGVEPQTAVSKRLHNMNDAYATPCTTTYKKGRDVDEAALEISSGSIEIKVTKTGTIELGKDAAEALIKGAVFSESFTKLLTALTTHTHPVSGATAAASVDLTTAINTAFPLSADVVPVNKLKPENFSTVSFTL